MKLKDPDYTTIGKVLQLEWNLSTAQVEEVLKAFFLKEVEI